MCAGSLRCPRSAGKGHLVENKKKAMGSDGMTAEERFQMTVALELWKQKIEGYVPPQDVYTVNEVALLLHVSPDRLRSFAKRDNDPFPIRHFRNGARGSFVLRGELIAWLTKSTVSAVDEARERKRAKNTRK